MSFRSFTLSRFFPFLLIPIFLYFVRIIQHYHRNGHAMKLFLKDTFIKSFFSSTKFSSSQLSIIFLSTKVHQSILSFSSDLLIPTFIKLSPYSLSIASLSHKDSFFFLPSLTPHLYQNLPYGSIIYPSRFL